ncbi:DUF3467 domain-containing protein [Malonomonas rubra]|uniref:DUF3467 domain-containing protein n=1 Tax=Malonomonas rubra TaxID=57040 RepID=UPI0026EC82CF|nr:DUF3467 domain-containing protein [Malonomonas rubra]
MEKKKETEVKLEIQIDDDVAAGQYINMVVINHNDSEFVLDCIFLQPQALKAKVRSRLITSPRHAKRLLLALQNNVVSYEKKYGVINLDEGKQAPVEKSDSPVH